jgi:hypothetical protein
MNSIEPIQMVADHSSSSLLSTTLFLSFLAVGYCFYSLKTKVDTLDHTKQDIDEEETLEEDMYQAWSGAFADGENSLLVTIVRQKVSTKKANSVWVDWNGDEDASVITRNFYLGNSDPSFSWTLQKRETDMEATVKETMTDGWNSVIQLKIVAYVKESETDMNLYFKKLLQESRIEWQKTLFSKRQFLEEFN